MPDARQALMSWQAGGGTQSLLSLHAHERLLAEIATLGIGTFFRPAEGRRGPTGGTKTEAMRLHIRRIGLDPRQVVAIGDTLDDADAARTCGIAGIVLYTGGSQHPEILKTSDAPLADTLPEAVRLARALVAQRTPAPTRER